MNTRKVRAGSEPPPEPEDWPEAEVPHYDEPDDLMRASARLMVMAFISFLAAVIYLTVVTW